MVQCDIILLRFSSLLLARQVLLDHASNLAIRVEVLADGSGLIQRPSNALRSAANRAVGYINS